MSITELFLQASIWSILLPFITGLILIRSLNKDSVIVWSIVTLATIPQILTAFIMNTTTQVVLYNIYTPLEFYLTYLLFRNKFLNFGRKVFIYSTIAYLLASLYFLFISGISKRFLNEWVCLSSLIYMLWVLLFLKKQYSLKKIEIDKRDPFTWFVLGIALYSPCTLLVFAFYHYLRAHPLSILKNLWLIHNFFNVVMYTLFTIGFIFSFYYKNRIPSQGHFKPKLENE
jgi:hypothetical protein